VAVLLVIFLFLFSVLAFFLGELGEALVSVALLYFAFGRDDYPTDLQRFLARARVGDLHGAEMLVTDPNALPEQGITLPDAALQAFGYRGFARWFPTVLYFWLLGPFAAVGYRLIDLMNVRSNGQFQSAVALLEWLPARVVLVTFSLLGDFEKSRSLLTDQAFDKTYSNQSLLSLSIARAWHLDLSAAETPTGVVDVVETAQKAISRATAVWIVAISLFALL
jgi:membrane protein required for beta-lactamase induction